MNTTVDERRKFPRAPLNSLLSFQVGESEYKGYAANISIGGLRLVEVQVEESIQVGELGKLSFYENKQQVDILCKIKHIDQESLGLEFLENE